MPSATRKTLKARPSALDAHHHRQWRQPADAAALWHGAAAVDPALLRCRVRGQWWETLQRLGITLLVTREYEHLLLAMTARGRGGGSVTYLPLPHPSGLAVDRPRNRVFVAMTRNPNQILELAPIRGLLARKDFREGRAQGQLMPRSTVFLPGCAYVHDLAMIGGHLYANAVGINAVIRVDGSGAGRPVWWPRCVERDGQPLTDRNYIQLNSIAAGPSLRQSFFSASSDRVSARRPGHANFPVDGRGVVFSGQTREPVVRGLTRPHSARLHRGRLWVDNSGYGEFGYARDGRFVPVAGLGGWTRGLCFHGSVAFVGTSRVIPRFRAYAPGLDPDTSVCGIHALDLQTGRTLGSVTWPAGNQVFAIDWIDARVTPGLPFVPGRPTSTGHTRGIFYRYSLENPRA